MTNSSSNRTHLVRLKDGCAQLARGRTSTRGRGFERHGSYSKRSGDFFEEAREAFPDRHEGFDDYGVAIVLSKKMLVAPTQSNQAAIDYLDSQRTITRNGADYWKPDNLRELESSISKLSTWLPLVESHKALQAAIDSLEKEIEQRIERIVKKIHPPDSSL